MVSVNQENGEYQSDAVKFHAVKPSSNPTISTTTKISTQNLTLPFFKMPLEV